MFINPEISKQLAAEHRRDMFTDAQHATLVRQCQAPAAGTARHRQPLTARLWRRLRLVTGLQPQA